MAVKRFVQALILIALLCGCVYAQTSTATLQGTVTDPGDAAVPGVAVELKNTSTGALRSTTTTAEGIFRFNSIEPAVYSLTIKAASGFKALDLNNINVTATEIRDLGRLKLALGALTEQVEVTAATTPVQTSSSENSKLVEGSQVMDITLKGGDLFNVLQTIPGFNAGDTYMTQGTAETTSGTAVGNISINGPGGGGGPTTAFTVDGIMDFDPSSGSTDPFEPNMDSIAEMRVLSTNYQAEYGRSDGATITVVTKSGSQEFHGGASANKRHEMFNAKNFFTNYNGQTKPQYRFFVWSYNIGGPVAIPKLPKVFKKKLFFFFSQEYTRQKPGPASGYDNVPSANERNGDFSYYTNSNGAIVSNSLRNPLTGIFYTPNTPSPTNPSNALFSQYAGNFDAASEKYGQAMLNFYPQPNLCNAASGTSDGKPWNGITAGAGGSNLISPTNCPSSVVAANPYLSSGNIDTQGGPGTTNNNTRNYYWQFQGSHPRRSDILRIDYNMTSRITGWFRWGNDYDQDGTGASMPLKNSTGSFAPTQIIHPNPGHNYAVGVTYTLTPTLVNEFTFGKTWNTWDYFPADQSQFARSNMGNPPSFNNFATDPAFINDTASVRPTLSPGSHAYMMGFPPVNFSGGQLTETAITNSGCGGNGGCPSYNWDDIYTYNDAISKVAGKHNLKAGIYVEKVTFPGSERNDYYLGHYNFAGGNVLDPHDTGDGWANAYLGQMNQYAEQQRVNHDSYESDIEFFGQDNWRVTRRLTLDLGARFYHLPPEVSGQIAGFYANTYNPAAAERVYYPFCTVSTATAACPSNSPTTTYQYAWDPKTNPSQSLALMAPTGQVGALVPYSVGGYTTASDPYTGMQVSGGNNTLIPESMWNVPFLSIGVRAGFAWDVFGNGKTAIRGGFGQAVSHNPTNDSFSMTSQAPVTVNQIQNFGSIASVASSPLDYTNGVRTSANNQLIGLSPFTPFSVVGMGSNNFEPNRSNYNGSFEIQQDIGFSTVLEASYVLSWARHAPITRNANNVLSPGVTTNQGSLYDQLQPSMINPLNQYLGQYIGPGANNASGMAYNDNYFRPIAGYGQMTYEEFAGNSNYNALQIAVRRNFRRHLSYGLAYTYAKTMQIQGTYSVVFPEKFRNWGPTFTPAPQVAVVNYVYEAPNLSQKLHFKPLGILTDHWSISGLTQFRSDRMTGYPSVSEYSNTNATTNVALTNTGTSLEGATALVVGNPELPSGTASFVGGPTTAAALNGNINGTPGNQILNNGSVIPVLPCSYTVQANPRLGIGQNMECFGNEGPGSLFPVPHTGVDNWDVTFTKNFPLKKEGRNLQFRLETFNLFNHPQFSNWTVGQSYDWANYKNGVSVPQTGTTGRYTTALQPRLMSLNLRLVF